MKKLTLLLALCLMLTACGVGQGTIVRFVEDHQTELEQAISKNDLEPFGIIEHIYIREEHIEFSCAAAGFGSETSYQGFFWSASDDALALWSGLREGDFVPEGEGWLWIQPDGDNICYVEHICGHFYYYEEHF